MRCPRPLLRPLAAAPALPAAQTSASEREELESRLPRLVASANPPPFPFCPGSCL